VGSAPASTGLLQAFRSIGIEIHNAYGLTEAPLITLNRFQANNIDSVGQPLPDTKIRIADDDEILVKGPQVMQGYFRKINELSLVNGWLHTGDLGLLTKDNYLIIHGRKKELIIDAYGKNINPVKVELALSDNTGINQIMVYGNNRPYCIALFWATRSFTQADINVIETGVKKANLQLSRPEQVKRWAVLADALSIADGDLTANLKMKRAALATKYTEIIEALYKQDKADFEENRAVVFGQID
jgi:long-chain acyl-CoA synthetase